MTVKDLLLVIDVQNDFLLSEGKLSLGFDTLFYRRHLAAFVNSFPGMVIATQDTHTVDSIELLPNNPKGFPEHCIKGTPGWELISELDKSNIDITFNKSSYTSEQIASYVVSEFVAKTPDLTIYVTGVCGHICVHDVVSSIINLSKNKLNKVPKVVLKKELIEDFDKEMMNFALKRLCNLYGVEIA